jgi:acetoin utilization protein AcuC
MPATRTTAFVYSDAYRQFDYGPGHPLRVERLSRTAERCRAAGLLDLPGMRAVETRPATDAELAVFHSPAYLEALRAADRGELPRAALGYDLGSSDNPAFPGVYAWSCLYAGASLQAMELVDSGAAACAFNIAGGLHHAGPSRASGFCYVNDAGVCIAHLVRRGRRVAYVDIDAHHGDGVQYAFEETDRVLTISLHETGETLFPGTGAAEEIGRGAGAGYAVNVPLWPGTDDKVFLWAFDQVVPPLLGAYAPDVVVTQLGIDAHRADPLAHLALSTCGFAAAIRRLRALCPRWIALGGGGYNVAVVAQGWTWAWAIMNDRELPGEVESDPEGRADSPATPSLQGQAWEFAREQVRRVQRLAFPYHGL